MVGFNCKEIMVIQMNKQIILFSQISFFYIYK